MLSSSSSTKENLLSDWTALRASGSSLATARPRVCQHRYLWARTATFPLAWLPAPPVLSSPGWSKDAPAGFGVVLLEGWTRATGFHLHADLPSSVGRLASATPHTFAAWVGISPAFPVEQWPSSLHRLVALQQPVDQSRSEWKADILAIALTGAVRANDRQQVARLLDEGALPLRVPAGSQACALKSSLDAVRGGSNLAILDDLLSRAGWREGETSPLHLAVEHKELHSFHRIIQYAAANGFPLNSIDGHGETVLIRGLRARNMFLKPVFDSGQNLTASDRYGVSTMALAVIGGYAAEVSKMLDQGASPGVGSSMAAAMVGRDDLAVALVRAGDDPCHKLSAILPGCRTIENKSALDMAKSIEARTRLMAALLEREMSLELPQAVSSARHRL